MSLPSTDNAYSIVRTAAIGIAQLALMSYVWRNRTYMLRFASFGFVALAALWIALNLPLGPHVVMNMPVGKAPLGAGQTAIETSKVFSRVAPVILAILLNQLVLLGVRALAKRNRPV